MGLHRDVGPLWQMVRSFLLGRQHTTSLRFADELACRDYPDPCYPPGSRERLSKNGYFDNDPRGEMDRPLTVGGPDYVKPPLLTAGPDQNDTASSSSCGPKASNSAATGSYFPVTPGSVSKWDDHRFYLPAAKCPKKAEEPKKCPK